MQNNKDKIQILSTLLGAYDYNQKSQEIAFFCPNCHHRKKKLMVNLEKNVYKCWVCNDQFSGKIINLFRKLHRTDLLNQWLSANNLDLKTDLKSIISSAFEKEKQLKITSEVELPLGTKKIDLVSPNNQFKNYLYNRGFDDYHIKKYNIMSCETEGLYKNRIIVPSFNNEGLINYYIGRSIYDSNRKYVNPTADKNNIIFNELFINWNRRIVLVEGVFDAIRVDDNAIPLLGSSISNSVIRENIIKYKPDVYFMLDSDAYSKQIDMLEKFIGWGINIFSVILESKDPADTPKSILTQKLQEAKKIDYKQLMISKFE